MAYTIELDGISWQQDQRALLQDTSWQVKQGEHWAVHDLLSPAWRWAARGHGEAVKAVFRLARLL